MDLPWALIGAIHGLGLLFDGAEALMGSFHDKKKLGSISRGVTKPLLEVYCFLSLSLSPSVFFLLPLSLFLPFLFTNVHFCLCAAWPLLEADLLTFAAARKSVAKCRSLFDIR